MDFQAFLHEVQSSSSYAGQVVYQHEEPACPAHYADPADPLLAVTQQVLSTQGITQLYTHQAAAIDATRNGKHVVVATGTASGKSLCYTIPLLETLYDSPEATALLLFPTKALCQNQFLAFSTAATTAGLDVLAGVYDGDTPAALRRRLRDHGSVLFTNPDMLHAGLLPQHARWASFLSRLKYLVLDELHVYSGIFGSNMTNVLRRFFRVCAHYGSHPQIIACSATIGNPQELAEQLSGLPFTAIDEDGSPRGKRTYVFWNPPVERARQWRSRRSANVEAHELMAMLVQRDVRTITFSKAHVTAELIYRYVTETLHTTAPQLTKKLAPYRGGLLPEERREIERRLFTGELLGVSTTRALELGVDIGGLDACILVGYPSTLASFFQQSGRAGRRADDALVILVGLDTPVNQYIMHHPEYVFGRPVECAVIDPDNPFVITGQLRCAAHEIALRDSECAMFGPFTDIVLTVLQENKKLQHIDGRWYHAVAETPQHEVPLRSFSGANVVIEDAESGAILGEVDRYDSQPLVHPDAIYLHNGETYRVLSLDLEKNIARVVRVETDYYTQPLGGTGIHHIDNTLREKPFGTSTAFWGEVTAHFKTWAFEKIHFYELDAISRHGLDLPTFVLETMSCWIVPPETLMEQVRRAGLDPFSGLRGIGYATRMILPLFITCDTLDFSHTIGAVNAPWNAIFIYERYPHGLGFTEKAYQRLHEIMPAVLAMIENCPCQDGCPCCVGKPLRGELTWNPERGEASIPSKQAAIMILRGLLGDGTNLHHADTQALTDSDAAARQRLEMAVRRRLERMREPQVHHPIKQQVPTQYPTIEAADTLAKPDVARRVERRRDFDKTLRKRLAERMLTADIETRKPVEQTPAPEKAMPMPTTPAPPQTPPTQRAVTLGDSLAMKARRMKKQRKTEHPDTGGTQSE
ncbi:MAG TPA: DEAD/DEAH box helicase [Armatimonadota bacterium]|nr:DEAD/DEAH box helicase [Armatimonadota bacterium]